MTLLSARQKIGLTQEEVAKKIGVHQTAVSFWESGKTFPSVKMLPKLARLYGCTVDELLSWKEE